MKARKTIAAIAALTLAVSSLSTLPFAVSANAEAIPAAAESANTETEETADSVSTAPEASEDTEDTDNSVPTTPGASEDTKDTEDTENTGAAVQTATVLTEAEYEALTDEEKASYSLLITTGDMVVTYMKDEDTSGTVIPYGSYVKKDTAVVFCVMYDTFNGSTILVENGEGVTEEYLTYNHSDAWCYAYTLKENDNTITASLGNASSVIIDPDDHSQLNDKHKEYYTKLNIQSPAYVWIGDNVTGGKIADGNYLLKGTYVWIAMPADDYLDNDIVFNGEPVKAGSSGGSDNFGILYRIDHDIDVINITSQATDCPKTTVKIEDGADIIVSYYVNDWTNGGYIHNGDKVRVGTPIMIGCYKNLIAGYDIVVNGEILPISLNGDGTYMLNGYTPASAETVISVVKRDELNEYEKANYVPVYFGSGINVTEFPFSSGISGDEWHITYKNGDIIGKGSELLILVGSQNYDGKVLKINGNTVNMNINGDGNAYYLKYVIPDNAASLNIELDTAPAAPSESSSPSAPSSAPTVSSPAASSTPASSSNASAAPSAKSVANDLKRARKSSISYNASEAGVTKDILTEFAKNKNARTMTAKFDNFRVKINKSDIKDAKALDNIDFSIKEKDFISKQQINKTNALKNSKKVVQLNFESSAEVSGLKKVNIQAKAGKSFNNSTAVVYELKGKRLVKAGTAKVDLNGYVSFNTDHLGQFVIAVN